MITSESLSIRLLSVCYITEYCCFLGTEVISSYQSVVTCQMCCMSTTLYSWIKKKSLLILWCCHFKCLMLKYSAFYRTTAKWVLVAMPTCRSRLPEKSATWALGFLYHIKHRLCKIEHMGGSVYITLVFYLNQNIHMTFLGFRHRF